MKSTEKQPESNAPPEAVTAAAAGIVEATVTPLNERTPVDRTLEERINERLAEESRKTQALFIAQEHRLLPAIGNLAEVFFGKYSSQRGELFPKAAMALGWCLIPSGGTITVGLVALLSLGLAWQQTRLLQMQNQKIETQNILAEAQRRSSLMFETSAIFEVLGTEREFARDKNVKCDPKLGSEMEKCWNEHQLFIHSKATSGRIASLTQALRPYRYMVVDTKKSQSDYFENTSCPENTTTILMNTIEKNFGLDTMLRPDKSHTPINTESLINIIATQVKAFEYSTPSYATSQWLTFKQYLRRELETDGAPHSSTPLSCTPSSPERGQLLLSLNAASVDISQLVKQGADFKYSDILGANFRGIRLSGVDLSYSRLLDADFENAKLDKVVLNGSYLIGAQFKDAKLNKVSFVGTTITSIGEPLPGNSIIKAKEVSKEGFEGARLFSKGFATDLIEGKSEIHKNWCLWAYSGRSGGRIYNNWWNGLALLVETRSDERYTYESGLIIRELEERYILLFKGMFMGESVTVQHFPLVQCKAQFGQ